MRALLPELLDSWTMQWTIWEPQRCGVDVNTILREGTSAERQLRVSNRRAI